MFELCVSDTVRVKLLEGHNTSPVKPVANDNVSGVLNVIVLVTNVVEHPAEVTPCKPMVVLPDIDPAAAV